MLLWNWPLTFLTEKNITISFFMFVEIYDKFLWIYSWILEQMLKMWVKWSHTSPFNLLRSNSDSEQFILDDCVIENEIEENLQM